MVMHLNISNCTASEETYVGENSVEVQGGKLIFLAEERSQWWRNLCSKFEQKLVWFSAHINL